MLFEGLKKLIEHRYINDEDISFVVAELKKIREIIEEVGVSGYNKIQTSSGKDK